MTQDSWDRSCAVLLQVLSCKSRKFLLCWRSPLLLRRSIGIHSWKKSPVRHTLSSFRILRRTRPDKPSEILGALPRQRNTCAWCWPWKPARDQTLKPSVSGGDWPPLGGRDGHLSSTWYCWRGCRNIIQPPVCFPTALGEMWCGTPPARPQWWVPDVGDVDTPWHPQFLSPVFFEFQRLTEDSPWKTYAVDFASSVFTSFGDADTQCRASQFSR